MVLNFGPVTKLTYPQNAPGYVFVITTGGVGSIGIAAADQSGDVITFTFSKYLCTGQTSFFFGLAAKGAPKTATATLFGIGYPPLVQTTAAVPAH